MQETLRDELSQKLGTFNDYRRNKIEYFELMEETIDELLPPSVISMYGDFATVKQFAQGAKPVFKRKVGKLRAKSFITKAAMAGVYETFKLHDEEEKSRRFHDCSGKYRMAGGDRGSERGRAWI